MKTLLLSLVFSSVAFADTSYAFSPKGYNPQRKTINSQAAQLVKLEAQYQTTLGQMQNLVEKLDESDSNISSSDMQLYLAIEKKLNQLKSLKQLLIDKKEKSSKNAAE